MKKLGLYSAILLMALSCQKENQINEETENTTIQNKCASYDVLKRQMKEDPSFATRRKAIETLTQKFVKEGKIAAKTIEIPVVVNVIYKTNAENISEAQIQSQIDVLNQDYQALNEDYNTANNPYKNVRSGSFNVHFTLEKINRKKTKKSSWSDNDYVKMDAKGGLAPTSPTTKLNLWICNLGKTLLGYAQFPGGPSETDGVVLHYKYTGTTGTATAPYNLGRTATHEVGHWMNLYHIWGDEKCGNDEVDDTPLHDEDNHGVPAVGTRSSCKGTPLEMYMNYMDYTDDEAMYMFTTGQKQRALAIFSSNGPRKSFR